MVTEDELHALVADRSTAHNHALARVRKARRDSLPMKQPIQDAARIAGLLADAWRELAKLQGGS